MSDVVWDVDKEVVVEEEVLQGCKRLGDAGRENAQFAADEIEVGGAFDGGAFDDACDGHLLGGVGSNNRCCSSRPSQLLRDQDIFT